LLTRVVVVVVVVEEEEVAFADADVDEENASVRTDVLHLPRPQEEEEEEEGVLEDDLRADVVVVVAYEVDALLAAQTNARLFVHARIFFVRRFFFSFSSLFSLVFAWLAFISAPPKKTQLFDIQKFERAVVTTRKHSESVKRNTRTCFLSPHPPSLELQCRLRLKVRAMRLSRAALEKAIPSAAIFAFFLFSARLNFWEQKRGRRGGEEEKVRVPAF